MKYNPLRNKCFDISDVSTLRPKKVISLESDFQLYDTPHKLKTVLKT